MAESRRGEGKELSLVRNLPNPLAALGPDVLHAPRLAQAGRNT